MAATVVGAFQNNAAAGTNCDVTIIGGTTGNASLNFGDSASAVQGVIAYNNSTDAFNIQAGASSIIDITSSQLKVKNSTGADPALAATVVGAFQNNAAAGTNCDVTIIGGTTGNASLNFGDSASAVQGVLAYENTTDTLNIQAGASSIVDITSSRVHVKNSTGTDPTYAATVVGAFQNNAAAGTNCDVTIIGGTTGNASLNFGDSGSAVQGVLAYENTTDTLNIQAGAASIVDITSSRVHIKNSTGTDPTFAASNVGVFQNNAAAGTNCDVAIVGGTADYQDYSLGTLLP